MISDADWALLCARFSPTTGKRAVSWGHLRRTGTASERVLTGIARRGSPHRSSQSARRNGHRVAGERASIICVKSIDIFSWLCLRHGGPQQNSRNGRCAYQGQKTFPMAEALENKPTALARERHSRTVRI